VPIRFILQLVNGHVVEAFACMGVCLNAFVWIFSSRCLI